MPMTATQSPSVADEPTRPRRRGIQERVVNDISHYALVIVGAVIVLIFALTTSQFWTTSNFSNIATADSVTLLLAVAVTVPLRAGGFDLSVSGTLIDAAILADILTTRYSMAWPLALLVTVAAAALVGLVNGILIVDLGLDGFIVTLGMSTLLTGIGFGLSGDTVLFNVPSAVLNVNRTDVFGSLPVACVYGWVIACVVGWIIGKTPVGRRLAVVGTSRETAALIGLRVSRLRRTTYVCSAVLAAAAGFILLGVIGSVDPGSGSAYLLAPFSAAFLGTTIGRSGRFNVLGTVIALYVLSITEQGLVLVGAPSWIADVFNGAALVGTLIFAKVWRGRLSRRPVR